MTPNPLHSPFRLQVTCDGVGSRSGAQDTVYQAALRALETHRELVRLANVRVEGRKGRGHLCHVQLFGHGLDHVGAQSEQLRLEDAVGSAVSRAIRSLNVEERFDPWTSGPPSSHRAR